MHDLRKKALLESGKTISRKAKARPDSKTATPITSPGQSPHGSRNGSRAGSRYASEDSDSDDSELDDVMTLSTYSGSDHGDDDRATGGRAWADRLQARVSQIVAGGRSGERKKMSNQEREDMLTSYLHLVRHYFAQSDISSSMDDLVLGLARAVRSGGSPTERTLALKALTVTILTNPTGNILSNHITLLKSAVEQEEEEEVRVAALYALVVAALYSDGSPDSPEAAEDMLQYMIEIVESDGHTVGAPDVATVVVAALKSWGFIATHLEDLSEQSEQAMEAFIEQLDSTDIHVQTGAGDNIALLFERAREMEEGESGERMNFQYDSKRLAQQMRDISKGSTGISRRDRRHLKSDFTSIATGLERGVGPGYSTAGRPASNPHTGGSKYDKAPAEFGYLQTVYVGKERIAIDSWALSAKVEFLRIVLAGGFPTHLAKNETVQGML